MISVTSEGNESDINSLQHALTDAIGCVEFYKKESDAAQAQRNAKDKQLADCYDRMTKAEAQRDKALVALNAIKEYWKEDITDRAMFDACWFAKNIAESVLKECWKEEKTAAVVFKQTKSGYAIKLTGAGGGGGK